MNGENQFERPSRELLRALRQGRSQAAFSRRLGFRSNVVAKWESGQRMPTAEEVVRFSYRAGNEALSAFASFHPPVASALGDGNAPKLSDWLNALRGSQRLAVVAEASGLSRYSVGRFLSGRCEPRLPQFLAVVDALTHRVEDLLDAWVGIEQIPSLQERFARSQAARDALFRQPLCLAVMCLLDTKPLDLPAVEQVETLCRTLERDQELVQECLQTLMEGGVIDFQRERYLLTGALTVDAHSSPEREREARGFWTQLAHLRTLEPSADDLCSYNVFSISREDYTALQGLQREFYRGARALIAASEPTEVAGLLLVQLLSWDGAQNLKS